MNKFLLPLLGAGLIAVSAVHANAATQVQASHAWIRVLPGDLPAGGYVTLRNNGDQPVVLTGATSTSYGDVMLHHSATEGGMSRMSMVKTLLIPSHATQALAPAGYHLMLMQARHPVHPGDTVQVSLKFSDGSSLPVGFAARPASALDDGSTTASPAMPSVHASAH